MGTTHQKRPGTALGSEAGFTIVTQLIGLVTAVLAFLGVGAFILYAGRLYQKSQAVNQMLTIENALLSWSVDRDAVAAVAPDLRAGQIPVGAEIKIDGRAIAKINGKLELGRDLAPCAADGRDCWTSTELSLRCQPDATGNACSMAYRIESSRADVTRFGVLHANAFSNEDYSIPLSFEITQRVESAECDRNTDLFASGFNKNTGNIICLKKPRRPCESGQISRGLAYNASTSSLEPVCEDTPTISCPQHYAVLDLNLVSLQPGQAPSGQCVVVTQKEVPWKTNPAPAPSVSGRYCPVNYKTKGQCALTNIVSTSPSCNYACNCTTTAEGVTTCDTCTCTAAAVPGSVTLQDGTRNASCAVKVPAQPTCSCGAQATWSANARLTGTCQLDESVLPETRPL
ncbi:MAG: hypothetical protein KF681_08095 [Bdellovibrionaceae bacterium]|nr:hypothetical protein [Pseudobdellovibrionaceae bacterium]